MKLSGITSRLILLATMTTIAPSSTAALPTAEPVGETVLLWPRGAPGAEDVKVREVLSERAPTLLIHAADDEAVPLENSQLMFKALRAAGVRTELHVFDRGGHGFGMRGVTGKDVAAWPQFVQAWALQ
jgi:acetyl esterase/lipase